MHVLAFACMQGIAVRGPVIGKEHAYVLVRDWLPAPPSFDRDAAVAELARRYLDGHGPADRPRPRALGRIAAARRARRLEHDRIRAARTRRRPRRARPAPPAAAIPTPRLLGAYEPVLLGWNSREEILGGHAPGVVSGGIFRPFALVNGRAVATWRLRGDEVELEPFDRLTRKDAAALEADAAERA